MSGKTRIRSTALQLKLLTDFLQTHPRLAHGEFRGPQGRRTENRQWEELRAMLSEHGPDKSIEQWKVTWRDLRRKARTEESVARQAATSPGNTTVVPILSEQAIKIIGIMGKGGKESGIKSTPAALPCTPTPVVADKLELLFDQNESLTAPLNRFSTFDERVGSSNAEYEENSNVTAEDSQQTADQQRPQLPRQNHRVKTTITSRTTKERQQRQRRQDLGARAKQFLKAKLKNNNILRDVVNQLTIANRYSAIRSRLTYKEKLWRLRKDLFK